MAKGFKDSSGKFHPTGNNGTSSRQKTLTPSGLRLRKNIKFAPEGQNIAPYNEARVIGNEIIDKVVEAFKESQPEYEDWKIHNTQLYNDYDTIQKTFYYSKDNVEKLLEWKQDPSPDTWKWLIPLSLENPRNEADVIAGEDRSNKGFLQSAYKGMVSIVLLSPRDYLQLACPKCLEMFDEVGFEGLDIETGKEFTKETIDHIAQRLKEGKTVDTVFLELNLDNMAITSHEGRHRAFGALKVGLEQIPVYIYTLGEMNDQQREEITNNPTDLTPYLRK